MQSVFLEARSNLVARSCKWKRSSRPLRPAPVKVLQSLSHLSPCPCVPPWRPTEWPGRLAGSWLPGQIQSSPHCINSRRHIAPLGAPHIVPLGAPHSPRVSPQTAPHVPPRVPRGAPPSAPNEVLHTPPGAHLLASRGPNHLHPRGTRLVARHIPLDGSLPRTALWPRACYLFGRRGGYSQRKGRVTSPRAWHLRCSRPRGGEARCN